MWILGLKGLNIKLEAYKSERIKKMSYVGSLARFKNKHTFSIEPFSSKSCLKNRAVSMFT